MATKKATVFKIVEELIVHLEAEYETFYKALAEYSPTKKLSNHGTKEHKDIEHQISTVLNDRTFGPSWEEAVNRLQEIVDHHVDEEEWVIHPAAKQVLTSAEANSIKEAMQEHKKTIKILLTEE